MSDSPAKSAIIEQLIESNARLSKLLELAHAENCMLETELQSSKVKIAGLLAGMNFLNKNHQISSVELVGVMLQAVMQKHGADTSKMYSPSPNNG